MNKEATFPWLRVATYILAGVFALSTALLAGILTANRPTGAQPTATPSLLPGNWEPYALRPGDTLFELARSRGISPTNLLRANGIASPNLSVGQVVYLPPLPTPTLRPGEPTPTPAPQPTPTVAPASTKTLALLDANDLTAAGAFVTSVGSLVGIVFTYLRSRREMELADRRHRRELELEKAKLELERLRLENQRPADDDSVRASVE